MDHGQAQRYVESLHKFIRHGEKKIRSIAMGAGPGFGVVLSSLLLAPPRAGLRGIFVNHGYSDRQCRAGLLLWRWLAGLLKLYVEDAHKRRLPGG